MSHDHIMFFEDQCPFCHNAVRRLIELDEGKKLQFAPLRGETARAMLTGPQERLKKTNSLVLAEHYGSTHRRFWAHSHAMLRTYWLIGNGWGLIGILSFLPRQIGEFIYNQFSAHRHQFSLKIPELPGPSERFLP